MSKSKHRKKKKRCRVTKQTGPVFMEMPQILKGNITKEEHQQFLIEAGKQYEDNFYQSLEKLTKSVKECNPIHLLSILAMHGLTVGMGESGKMPLQEQGTFFQPHAELVQALALQIIPEELNSGPVMPENVQEIWDCAIELSKAFSMSRLEQASKTKTVEEKALLALQERIRTNTQMVRNWGYYSQVIRLSNKLFKPLDDVYVSSVGITASNIINVFQYLVEQFETRVNDHWVKIKPVMRSKSIQSALVSYQESFPDVELGDMEDFVLKNKVSLEGLKSLLLSQGLK